MTLHGLLCRSRNLWRLCLRKESGLLDMGMVADEMERRHELALEDMQTAQLLTAFVTEHLHANLGRLPGTIRGLLASPEAWLRVERRLSPSSS